MFRIRLFVAAALVSLALDAQQAPPKRKRLLAIGDGQTYGYQHESVSHALAVIERLGRESGLYDTVIRTLRGQAHAEVDGYEGLRSLEVVIAAYRSARDGVRVGLPLVF